MGPLASLTHEISRAERADGKGETLRGAYCLQFF